MSDTVLISSATNMLYLCRLCGTETISQDKLINIFDTNGVALNIKLKITNCLGFDVSDSDYLPKVVCAECVDNLEKFNEFKIRSGKTAIYLIDLLKKQISFSNNVPPKQIDINQITEPKLCIKKNNINEVSNTNPTFLVQIPLSKTFNVYNPSSNIKKIIFQSDSCEDVFPTHAQSIDHNHTKHIKSSNKVKIRINVKKSKTKRNKEIQKEYKCANCPRICDTRRKMLLHLLIHREIIYNCTICSKKIKGKISLTKHMKLHNNQYDYVCNYCGKCFLSKYQFDIHVRTTHTKDYPFHCTKCDKKFPSKGGLKIHDQTVHNDNYSFTCEICNKSFKTKYYLHAHKKIHIPKEKRLKFKCHLCDASFVQNEGLKKHMFGHTGELKYGCALCDKRYKDKTCLKAHLLTHSGEKNCVCDICGKAFALPNNLKDHCRIHTGERPFKCNLCLKTFTQKSALNRHKKSCSKVQNKN
jgi:uncharacterized Zn-finger protein